MLCERTDNEASGSTEALAVTLIKYNYNSIKTTVDTAMLRIEQKIQSHIHKPSQTVISVDRSSSMVGPFICPSVCAVVWSDYLSGSPLCCQCICMFVCVFYMIADMFIICLVVCVDVRLRQFSCRPLPVV